jgi:hypothetical protein
VADQGQPATQLTRSCVGLAVLGMVQYISEQEPGAGGTPILAAHITCKARTVLLFTGTDHKLRWPSAHRCRLDCEEAEANRRALRHMHVSSRHATNAITDDVGPESAHVLCCHFSRLPGGAGIQRLWSAGVWGSQLHIAAISSRKHDLPVAYQITRHLAPSRWQQTAIIGIKCYRR